MEKYLSVVDIRKYKIALFKFWWSSHDLCVENGRHCNVHIICPLYEELRTKYLPQVRFGNISMFIKILSTKTVSRITELACYLFHCFNKRSLYLAGQT